MARPHPCPRCGSPCYGQQCIKCRNSAFEKVERVLEETAAVAPTLPKVPGVHGDFMVCSDTHIPFHHPASLLKMCEAAELLGVRKLVIAGDLLHADIISKYVNAGKQVSISDELVACGQTLAALELFFDEIHVVVGNHDQRLERMVANWRKSEGGAKALEIVARMLDVPADADEVAYGILERFLSSDKVTVYPLPDITINGVWLVVHPGSCSRIPPQTERKLAEKFRKSVIGGHNHLWGLGFDSSGTDVAFDPAHMADDSKFRYVRERQTTFPKSSIRGFGAILCDKDAPNGRLLPIALHERMFDLAHLKTRLTETS